jgi:hypothetical protein
MAFGGTPAEHCVRANEYAEELLYEVRQHRRRIENSPPDMVERNRKLAYFDVSVAHSSLRTERAWTNNVCRQSSKVEAAMKAAADFKAELFSKRAALDGTSAQHCEVASRQVQDLLNDLPIMKARFARTGNRCKFARKMAASLHGSRERLDAEQGWSERSCIASTGVKFEPVVKFMRQMERFSKSCDEEADSERKLDGLELANLWPLYLLAGSVGLWYWNAKKA